MRDKDADFVHTLLKEQMIDIHTLCARILGLDGAKYPASRLVAWANRRAQEAESNP
jgi:hypothetical protein